MGLRVSHDCWRASYSSFMQWRCVLAKAIGIALPVMEGFVDPTDHTVPLRIRDYLPMRWDALKPDPLHVLLNHSDCDGELAVADLLPIAERLEQVGPNLPDDTGAFPDWNRKAAARFAKGLRAAAAAGEPVVFM